MKSNNGESPVYHIPNFLFVKRFLTIPRFQVSETFAEVASQPRGLAAKPLFLD
jgi:hypothetical protein